MPERPELARVRLEPVAFDAGMAGRMSDAAGARVVVPRVGGTPELARVKRAAAQRARWDTEWRASIRAARDAGHSFRVVGRAAGITAPGVRKITVGRPPKQ